MSVGGDTRPLAGRRVLVTRPRAQAAEFAQQLEAAGALVVISPTIRVVPPADSGPLLNAAANLSAFDWIVVASANAVDALMTAVSQSHALSPAHCESQPAPAPTRPSFRIAAVGPRTAERLAAHGLEATVVPAEYRAETLVTALTAHAPLAGARVLLPRSEIGRDTIAEGVRAAGAIVTDVVAYRIVPEVPDSNAPDVLDMLARGHIDAVTFTSGSAVRRFVEVHGPDAASLLRHTVVAAIGPLTAEAARAIDVPVHVQPATYTTAALVSALENYFAAHP